MSPKDKELLKALIREQLAVPPTDENGNPVDAESDEGKATLIPLTPGQIDKMAVEISNKFLNNIFASVKTSLGPSYYDNALDKLYKDVKLRKSLSDDFKTFVSKVLSTVAKQPTGQGEPGVGVNKTNI